MVLPLSRGSRRIRLSNMQPWVPRLLTVPDWCTSKCGGRLVMAIAQHAAALRVRLRRGKLEASSHRTRAANRRRQLGAGATVGPTCQETAAASRTGGGRTPVPGEPLRFIRILPPIGVRVMCICRRRRLPIAIEIGQPAMIPSRQQAIRRHWEESRCESNRAARCREQRYRRVIPVRHRCLQSTICRPSSAPLLEPSGRSMASPIMCARGETLCVVGESGCGKSVTALSITAAHRQPARAHRRRRRSASSGRDLLTLTEARDGATSAATRSR